MGKKTKQIMQGKMPRKKIRAKKKITKKIMQKEGLIVAFIKNHYIICQCL